MGIRTTIHCSGEGPRLFLRIYPGAPAAEPIQILASRSQMKSKEFAKLEECLRKIYQLPTESPVVVFEIHDFTHSKVEPAEG